MGMTAARKLDQIVENGYTILACEWMAAAQAVDLRPGIQLGQGTAKTYQQLRHHIPFLDKDRSVGPQEIALARNLISEENYA